MSYIETMNQVTNELMFEVLKSPDRGSVNPSPLGDRMHSIRGWKNKLLSEFASLRKRYWGQHLWARGYWVCSSGNVTDDMWKEYIENQKPPEPDDDFRVV